MANITQILGAQAALPTTTGTATSFSEAPLVRLYNSHASDAFKVTVVPTQGATGADIIGSFTMPSGSVEYLRKKYTQCIFAADAAILGAKVGFTK